MEIKFVEQVELTIAGLAGPRTLTPMEAMKGDTLDQFMALAEVLDQARDAGDFKTTKNTLNELLKAATSLTPEDLQALQMGQKRAILQAIFKTPAEPPAQKKTER